MIPRINRKIVPLVGGNGLVSVLSIKLRKKQHTETITPPTARVHMNRAVPMNINRALNMSKKLATLIFVGVERFKILVPIRQNIARAQTNSMKSNIFLNIYPPSTLKML